MSFSFSQFKRCVLAKPDKSKKGSIDKHIKSLVDKLNKSDKYCTTSTCSGRIVLFEAPESGKKHKSRWLFTSHEPITQMPEIRRKNVWFRFEPAILHVVCMDLETAQKLVETARNIGFKMSGIISTKKCAVELRCVERIDVPTLVIADYKILIKEANKKLRQTWRRVKRLEQSLKLLK